MIKSTFALKLEDGVARKFKNFCKIRGIKYGFFVEQAIKEKLEQEELKEDLTDFKTLRAQEPNATPWQDYLKKRNV